MEYEKAVHISKVVDALEKAESKLANFNKTKEFCKIIFKGENGAEVSHTFTFESDDIEVKKIRAYIESILENQVLTARSDLKLLQ